MFVIYLISIDCRADRIVSRGGGLKTMVNYKCYFLFVQRSLKMFYFFRYMHSQHNLCVIYILCIQM